MFVPTRESHELKARIVPVEEGVNATVGAYTGVNVSTTPTVSPEHRNVSGIDKCQGFARLTIGVGCGVRVYRRTSHACRGRRRSNRAKLIRSGTGRRNDDWRCSGGRRCRRWRCQWGGGRRCRCRETSREGGIGQRFDNYGRREAVCINGYICDDGFS